MINTQRSLFEFKQEIEQEQLRNTPLNNFQSSFYNGIVTAVNETSLTADVFIPIMNTELKELSVAMNMLSDKGGTIVLPQIEGKVIVVFAPMIKPFILISVPPENNGIPQIGKGETLTFTNNTITKHTNNGSIVNSANNALNSILGADGVMKLYSRGDVKFSDTSFKYNLRNNTLGPLSYEKTLLRKDSDDGKAPREKLEAIRDKLLSHRFELTSFKEAMLASGLDTEAMKSSVSQLKALLYNEYKSAENFLVTQEGTVLDKDINNLEDMMSAKEDEIKYSLHGNKLVYERLYKTKDTVSTISIDDKGYIDIVGNKVTINGKEV